MLTDCKCGANIEARLDVESNDVICTNCNEVIEMNNFTKEMLKTRGDIIERLDVTVPPNGLKYTCDNAKCGKPFSAEVNKKKNVVFCPYCKYEAKVSTIVIEMLKSNDVYEGYTKKHIEGEDNSYVNLMDQIAKDDEKHTSPSVKAVTRAVSGSEDKTSSKGKGRPKGSKNKAKATKVVKVGTSKKPATKKKIDEKRSEIKSES